MMNFRKHLWGWLLTLGVAGGLASVWVSRGSPSGWIVAVGLVALSAVAGWRVTVSWRQEIVGLASDLATRSKHDSTEGRILREAIRALTDEADRTLDQLSQQLSLKDQVLSSMEDGVLVVEDGGEVSYENEAASELLEVGSLRDQLPQDRISFIEVHHPQRRTIRAVGLPLDQGRRLVVLRDVTEALRIEAMRRDFVADVSHELKTPVAGILASAETLEVSAQDDPASVGRFTASLVAESRRLSRLVEDLLDLARLEEPATESGLVDLSSIVDAELIRAEDEAKKKELRLVSAVDRGVKVTGRGEELALVARNLLSNAIQYTEAGSVTVGLRRNGDGVILEVADTGIGIPLKERPRIFERFYRVDKARSRQTGGTGLGLSIVRHVVEGHEGSIEVESELDAGSMFKIRLPAR